MQGLETNVQAGNCGSGFILDPSGTILTNAHVVADAVAKQGQRTRVAARLPPVHITLQDGRVFEGRVIACDRCAFFHGGSWAPRCRRHGLHLSRLTRWQQVENLAQHMRGEAPGGPRLHVLLELWRNQARSGRQGLKRSSHQPVRTAGQYELCDLCGALVKRLPWST